MSVLGGRRSWLPGPCTQPLHAHWAKALWARQAPAHCRSPSAPAFLRARWVLPEGVGCPAAVPPGQALCLPRRYPTCPVPAGEGLRAVRELRRQCPQRLHHAEPVCGGRRAGVWQQLEILPVVPGRSGPQGPLHRQPVPQVLGPEAVQHHQQRHLQRLPRPRTRGSSGHLGREGFKWLWAPHHPLRPVVAAQDPVLQGKLAQVDIKPRGCPGAPQCLKPFSPAGGASQVLRGLRE